MVQSDSGPLEALCFEIGSHDRSHLALVYYLHRPWVGWVLKSRVSLCVTTADDGSTTASRCRPR